MRNCQENEHSDFTRTQMKKETILRELKARGGRITKQRKILLDIILEEQCDCCKEIYYKAIKRDPAIGSATVYRTISLLEDIGAISRNKMYEIQYEEEAAEEKGGFGMQLAGKIFDRHFFFQEILMNAGVDLQQAESEACMLEHVLSDDSFSKLKGYIEKEK